MTFSVVTPFGLVRTLAAAGVRNPAIYLLICDTATAATVQADLQAEATVQLSATIRAATASQVLRDKLPPCNDGSVRLIYFDAWLPDLVKALDRHSAILVQDGGQLILLCEEKSAERILSSAPNLRSRLTDVFHIGPDRLSGGCSD
jgi:hypothetical protein